MNTRSLLDAVKFLSVALVFAVASFFVLIFWTSEIFDEPEDPLIISVDYDCREIANNADDIPRHVIEECALLIERQRPVRPANKTDTTV